VRGVTKPAAERIAHDAYFTPQPLADAICETLDGRCGLYNPIRVLEPSCGGGSFLRAATTVWPMADLRGVDLAPTCDGPGLVEARDLFGLQLWGHYSLILGNPPYLQAERMVGYCLDLLAPGGTLAFLLRLSFLGGQGRSESLWSRRNLRWLAPITPRPSFTPDGKTDAAEYALFVWRRDFCGNAELLAPLRWERLDNRTQTTLLPITNRR